MLIPFASHSTRIDTAASPAPRNVAFTMNSMKAVTLPPSITRAGLCASSGASGCARIALIIGRNASTTVAPLRRTSASHDDALAALRAHAATQTDVGALHLDIRFTGSVDAIRALNEGRCNIAGFHAPLQPPAPSLMARTYKPLLKPGQHKIMAFALRQQGLMVAPGNPLGLQGLSDLTHPPVRFINRSLGTGTRLLLDNSLEAAGLQARQIRGYGQEESSHAAVAACVASGQADAGLGIASAAQAHGLDFVPLWQECYWLVCLKSVLDTAPVQALATLLQSPAWQRQLAGMTGYDMAAAPGQVQSLKVQLPWWTHAKGKPRQRR